MVEDYPNCCYCKCELQYVIFQSNLATIERTDDSLGHIKSNCVIACKSCNVRKIKTNQSDYYRKNIKEITSRRDKKIKCECGRTVSNSGFSAHQKTLIHLETVNKPYTIDRIDFSTPPKK